ncbi:hypothetical protein HYV89_03680 [Candidatus Woesearchaeota archaeon]|nr:hypothetical protein [Candidatus Woesearchaeota archaeon]
MKKIKTKTQGTQSKRIKLAGAMRKEILLKIENLENMMKGLKSSMKDETMINIRKEGKELVLLIKELYKK